MRHQLLVVDDDEKITSMLRRSLTFEGYEVDTASNGHIALQKMMEKEPHLLILDVMMPEVDGWEVCRRLREVGSQVPILMLTAKDEVKDRVKGLDIGADDYLVKPFALEELLARVRALLRRYDERKTETVQLSFEDLKLDTETREVFRGKRKIELTTREFDLLHMFMVNPRKVLAKEQIMDRIWGYDYTGESNVIEVYIAMLRQKLEEQGEKRLIHTVRGAGYVLRGDD